MAPTRGSTSTANATAGSGATPGLGEWVASSASGPFAGTILEGGTVQCTFGGKDDGIYWDLQPIADGDLGSIYLAFDQPDPDAASVEIMESGNKETLATGTAVVSRVNGTGDIIGFGFSFSYEATDSGGSGAVQGSGACRQETPNN